MHKFIGWLCYFIATGFFTGRLGRNGKGGGTCGSILALLIQFLLVFWIQPVWWVYPVITVAIFALGLAVVGPAEQYAYERYGEVPRHDGKIGMYDRNEINIDEVFGMFVANNVVLALVSVFGWSTVADLVFVGMMLVFGFFMFRYFDIYKRPAARWFESRVNPSKPFGLGTSLSIMMDDLVAALPASCMLTTGILWVSCTFIAGSLFGTVSIAVLNKSKVI